MPFGLGLQSTLSYSVDGISVTHDFPHHYIWTFAAGVDETGVTDQGTYRTDPRHATEMTNVWLK